MINNLHWKDNVLSFFKNKKNNKLVLITIFMYLFFLVLTLPASVVVSWLTLPANTKIANPSGSIWLGKAESIRYSGVDLGALEWELHPLSFFLGELSADVSIIKNKEYFRSEVSLSPSGKIELEETRFFVELSSFQALSYGMPFSYDGIVSGYFPVSHFYKDHYIGLNGKLSLNSIKLISPQRQLFGDFTIDFRAENKGLSSGKIKDNGGPLELSGKVMLDKNGLLNLTSKLFAREKGGSLEKMISFLGQKDGSGRIQIKHSLALWK